MEFGPKEEAKSVKAVAILHRNKNAVAENSFVIAHGFFMTTAVLANNAEFNLRDLKGYDTLEDASAAIATFDGTKFEGEWAVVR